MGIAYRLSLVRVLGFTAPFPLPKSGEERDVLCTQGEGRLPSPSFGRGARGEGYFLTIGR
jgi:hypothetical protein